MQSPFAIRSLSVLVALKIYLLLAATPTLAQTQKLSAAEAKEHVGQQATVCGRVATARYADRARGKPTFLDIEKPYPKQVFTILIWGENRSKFGTPEDEYRDKNVCVTGQITSYRGAPEIVASEPGQLAITAK